MKITDVRVVLIESPDDYGLDATGQESTGPKRTCIFVVDTDEGVSGVSQIESQPGVARAIVDAPGEFSGLFSGLRALALGQDPLQVEPLWQRLYLGSFYFGRHGAALQAISGIDIACWDIVGKYAGLPVATMLGGQRRTDVPVYASTLFRRTSQEMKQAAHRYVDAGFDAVKFGWGCFGDDPRTDVEMVAAAREALGPQRRLMVDSGWKHRRTAKEAISMVKSLAEFEPYWVEEPCFPEDYGTYRRLAESVDVRIAAGEAEDTTSGFRRLMDAGLDVLQPDLSRCGGFTVARRVAYEAEDRNVMVCPHAWGSQILTAATLQFLGFLSQESMLEFNTSSDPVSRNLLAEPLVVSNGRVALPTGPGLGIEVDMEAINRLAGVHLD